MGAKKMGEREEIKIRITTKIKSASRSISMSARESEMKRTWSGIRGLGSRPDSTASCAFMSALVFEASIGDGVSGPALRYIGRAAEMLKAKRAGLNSEGGKAGSSWHRRKRRERRAEL